MTTYIGGCGKSETDQESQKGVSGKESKETETGINNIDIGG